jgi:hypothetical protein
MTILKVAQMYNISRQTIETGSSIQISTLVKLEPDLSLSTSKKKYRFFA